MNWKPKAHRILGGALCILGILAGNIGEAQAATVLDTGVVANADFQDSFASGLSSNNLAWDRNQNSATLVQASNDFYKFYNQGFSGPDMLGYFVGPSLQAYTPVVVTSKIGLLEGLSFQVGTGYNYNLGVFGYWEGYRAGAMTGSGSFHVPSASYINFSDTDGFDEIRVGVYYKSMSSFDIPATNGNGNGLVAANAAGRVLTAAGIPEPRIWGMMILGFAMIGGRLRRRKGMGLSAIAAAGVPTYSALPTGR